MTVSRKRITCVVIFLAVLIALIYIFGVRGELKFTVVEGEQDNGLSHIYGYKVESYANKQRTKITIWHKLEGITPISNTLMKSEYTLISQTVDKVNTVEWIKSKRAIYLDLQITYHDSIETTHTAKIIYDYHMGQMYICSDASLWRLWVNDLVYEDWLSDSEFEKILSNLRSQ